VTKSQLVELMASKLSNLSKRDIELVVDTVFKSMTDTLSSGERIEIRGMGTFSVRTYEEREGRNPKTGEKVIVPSKNAVHFVPGRELKARIDNGRK